MSEDTAFHRALLRILRPLVRVAIARGLAFPGMADLLKTAYVEAAQTSYSLGEKRLTDSRISLLTGLQRKDVKRLRMAPDLDPDRAGHGAVARVMARWQALGEERRTLRRSDDDNSFEALVAGVSRDVHPRTVLDELVRLGLACVDGDRVTLSAEAYVPSRDDTGLVDYFGANLGDHAQAASDNVLAAPDPGPFYERAVHYNRLTGQAARELQALAGALQNEALGTLNARAQALQARDCDDPDARSRIRIGAFVYRGEEAQE